MANNEFGGSLYRSQQQMLDDIAYCWLSSRGETSEAEQREILGEMTDDALAEECIGGWGLNQAEDQWPLGEDEEGRSHMDEQGYGTKDLTEAFGRLRERLLSGGEP